MAFFSTLKSLPAAGWQQINRMGALGFIILLHVVFFYALQSGLLHRVSEAMPREVFATFITPEQPRQPQIPKPTPAPKTVPIVHKTTVAPTPVPVVNNTPSPQAITVPTPPSAPSTEPPAVAAPPAAPAPPAPALPKTISGVEYIREPQAEYPAMSRRLHESGKVMLRALVNESGHAEHVDVKISSGSPRLDEAARQAVLHALFKPYLEDGKAVPVYVITPISFGLN